MNDKIKLDDVIAFYYFISFFSKVNKKKSNRMRADKESVMRILFAKIIYEGYGASAIIIELLEPPKNYPTW